LFSAYLKTDGLKVEKAIRAWAPEERPRERMMNFGGTVLTDTELLAILLGSGLPGESALSLARRILDSGNGRIHGLAGYSVERLQQFRGIGPAKAVTVAAALEAGRRLRVAETGEATHIRQSRDAFLLMGPGLCELDHEQFWVMCLNNANRVLSRFQLSKGGITGTLVDVRIILRKALEVRATSLILAHNHPSGNLRPSKADRQITRKVQRAAKLMDIRVLDHIIVNGSEYFSFADESLL
jgi:DNA repair protein RadC